jgi:uncharacterized protein
VTIPRPTIPFYFRQSVKPLFGCLHEPLHTYPGQCAVLICPPMGHEYVNSHRALRQLAARLTDSGFPVLRFDYYGTGDSYGNTEDCSVGQWLEDIIAAIVELKHRSGRSQVCLVGLRLGATLAWLASIQTNDVRNLVLWEPVKDGKAYLQEVFLLHRNSQPLHSRQRAPEHSDCLDILGFRFSRLFTSDLEQIDLLTSEPVPVQNVLIIRGKAISEDEDLRSRLEQSPCSFEQKSMPAPPFWQPNPEGSLLVPAQQIQSIVSWTCGASS